MKQKTIIPFRGFGTPTSLVLHGRIVYGSPQGLHSAGSGIFSNIFAMWRRYSARPVVGDEVTITLDGQTISATTDEYGVFSTTLHMDTCSISNSGWHTALYTITGTTAKGDLYVDCVPDEYGIISDVDDTILISRASNIVATVWTLITGSAQTRHLFPRTAELFNRLQKGSSGSSNNPFFYISSSHWQLYDFLFELFTIHNLPKGVFLLKRVRSLWGAFLHRKDHEHKYLSICRVLDSTGNLPVVLFGDTAQMDAALYVRIVKNYPSRIRGVYLRDVVEKYSKPVRQALDKVDTIGIPFIIASTTAGIITHAEKTGLIQPVSNENE